MLQLLILSKDFQAKAVDTSIQAIFLLFVKTYYGIQMDVPTKRMSKIFTALA